MLFAGASNGIIWEFSVSQVEVSIVRVGLDYFFNEIYFLLKTNETKLEWMNEWMDVPFFLKTLEKLSRIVGFLTYL